VGRFDIDNRRIHGLYHKIENIAACFCPACLTRRMPA
jgi:hypothetical protein